MIKFEVSTHGSTFLDPRKGFAETTEEFEIRHDPLTGRSCHLSHFGAIKPQKLLLERYGQAETKGICPFCPELRDKAVPRFPGRVLPEGRLTRGEAMLIPNLFPYDIYSGIIIMAEEHVVPLERLAGRMTSDAFSLGVEFLKRMKRLDGSLPYHVIAWNYMPPSGGGLVHPHQQCFATQYPGNRYLDELEASRRFYEAHGRSFWDEYVEEEKGLDQRYIGTVGGSHWLSAFAPLGLLGDTVCVFPDVFSVEDFMEEHLAWLVEGLGRLFAWYRESGIYSFNASLFFGPAGQKYFPCHASMAPRTFLNTRDFAPDANFCQLLLCEPVSVVRPEQLCRDAVRFFVTA